MKRFLRQVLAVVIGNFVALVLLFGAGAWLLFFQSGKKPLVDDPAVLQVNLHGKVVERASDALLEFLKINREEVVDLVALKKALQQAQEDPKVRGIYLEANDLKAGWAQLEEIREALLAFQQTGKFIVAYGENYSQKAYYVASLADDIVLHPAGMFPFRGLSQTAFFYKALLDKLEVAPQVFRVGKYKSAVEPFTRRDMSQASKHQGAVLLEVIYSHFLDKIATARALPQASLRTMADKLSAVIPQDACRAKLVSQVGHESDAAALIKAKLSLDEEATVNYVAYDKYAASKRAGQFSSNQIAVLLAEGAIVDGKGAPDTIGAKDLTKSLKALREDESIKAVVIRINSPGGSALASDVLWQEIVLTKAHKPVVASLSNVAASGGYYMAAACDRIFAHPTTITGSVGIFGLFFDAHALLSNKLGITTDAVKTNRSADLLTNPGRTLSDHEKEVIQKVIDKGYDTFLERVATGRNMPKEAVAQIAAGRVWPGQLAQQKGLVDELGGLEEAIQAAAKLAAIEDAFTVSYWPKATTLPEQILKDLKGAQEGTTAFAVLQTSFPDLKHIQELSTMTGIQARLPYSVEIE
ncbi:MAG: signal peptide peptidase SppA [Roseivirga sp.]